MRNNPETETLDEKIERIERKLDIIWDVLILVIFSIGGFYVKTALETVIQNEIVTNIFIFVWVVVFVWLNSEFKFKKKI